MTIGELSNFAAYTFAPAILVSPLGALSVLIGSILASFFLNEELGSLGRIGCAICLIGSIIIVLHAPPEEEILTVDQILHYAMQPGFLFYCLLITIFAGVMITTIAPKYGKKNPLIYISICSTVGSISIMAVKGFGVALKLTFAGYNQFTHPSTYVFAIVVTVCILIQINYFNKALDAFSTSLVNPLYYVTFATSTLCASYILFQGFNTTLTIITISLICGFLIIFTGVYLLNFDINTPLSERKFKSLNTDDPRCSYLVDFPWENRVVAGMQAHRRSMQGRRSPQRSRSNSAFKLQEFNSPLNVASIEEEEFFVK